MKFIKFYLYIYIYIIKFETNGKLIHNSIYLKNHISIIIVFNNFSYVFSFSPSPLLNECKKQVTQRR